MAEDRTVTKIGTSLKLFVFSFLALLGLPIFSWLLSPFQAIIQATLHVFAAASVANAVSLRIYERGRLADIGLQWNRLSAANLGIGLGSGIGAALLVTAVPLLVGAAELKPSPEFSFNFGSIVFVSILLLFGAIGEEMLFRGYAFQVLITLMGRYATLLPAAIIFAAAHRDNLNSSPLSLFNTFAMGVLLGYAFLRSGDLWLPIGLHFGWNWTLPMFGVNLSGFTMGMTGYVMHWNVGALWSGGEYGPEAGLVTSLVVPVLGYALWRAPVRKQESFLLRGMDDDGEF
jgi:membrane protease YdiL (CAAX protease family)